MRKLLRVSDMLRALDLQQSLHGSGQSSVYLSTRETIAHVVPAPGIPFYSPRLLLAGDRVADRIMPLPHKSSLEFQESMNMENSAAATGLERSVFIPIPKKQCQRMLKLLHNCIHLTC